MPQGEPQQSLMPSLLDRLTDPESGGTAWRRGYGVEQMVVTVQRDLEDLLNTRQSTFGLSQDYPEVNQSIIAFGLPDLTSLNAVTSGQREEIGRVIEKIVTTFEPRLKDVRAFLLESTNERFERTLQFRIEARLNVDPAPEVAFDTVLELTTGHYSIKPPSS
jgi:type VI secretion system protein ImpF